MLIQGKVSPLREEQGNKGDWKFSLVELSFKGFQGWGDKVRK